MESWNWGVIGGTGDWGLESGKFGVVSGEW